MIRIVKEYKKILFLLAGIFFIQGSYAQTSLVIKGGSSDGLSASGSVPCIPTAITAKGGAYDGAGVITVIGCNIQTSLVAAGGANNGISGSASTACTPSSIVAAGGSYDGASVISVIGCNIQTSLVTSGGDNNGLSASASAACTPTSIVAAGGSYDGAGVISVIGCNIQTSLVTAGGDNNGLSASALAACSYSSIAASGGAYDGAGIITSIACNVQTSLVTAGGDNNGLSVSASAACNYSSITSSGGSYDGADASVLRCNSALYIVSINSTGALCQCSGISTVSATGGTAPYTYKWSTGGTTTTSTGLCPGIYYVTVTDATLAQTVGSTTVGQFGLILSTTFSISPATCGNNNGSATVSVSGGTPPYTYAWYNGATTTSINSLSSGTYTVTIADAGGCTLTSSVALTQPPLLTATISSQTNISCYGATNGSATASVSGGTPPYSYSWSNSATTASLSSLAAGTYSVTVTDNIGCASVTATAITTPVTLTAPITVQTNISCNGNTDGSITVNPSGGTIPYTYIWNTSPVQTTATANNLAAGVYTVTVKDAHNCTATTTATITQPAVLSVSASVNTPVCYGTSINLTSIPTGGTTAYSYSWTGSVGYTSTDGNPTIASATTANSGTYYLTVTDANGCSAAASASIVVTICTTTLNLNVYIEGYYIGSGQMQPTVLNQSVPTATGLETDTIYVLLHDTGNPAIVTDSVSAILMTTGAATAVFNGTATGNSYWIAIRHRNVIETWSSSAVLFTPVTSYDFTITASQAYGSNMIQVDYSPDLWAVYNGDINQDQNVDLLDFPDMDYGINNGLFGYYNTDLNGDGNVDLLDFPILDANINNGIYSFHP